MGLFSGITDMFSPSSSSASKNLAKLEPMYREMYQPYIDYGMSAMPTLQQQYAQLLNNPQALWTQLSQGYEESPGFNLQRTAGMNAANQAAAAGGMLGTNAHQTETAQLMDELASQDYYDYMGKMLGLWGTGLEGTQGMFNTGFNATQGLAGNIGNAYGAQANLGYAQSGNQNQFLGGLIGAGLGAFGGPAGAVAGSQIGSSMMSPNSGWMR